MGLERLEGLYEAQLGGEHKGYWIFLPHVPKELAGGWASSDLREGGKAGSPRESPDLNFPTPLPTHPWFCIRLSLPPCCPSVDKYLWRVCHPLGSVLRAGDAALTRLLFREVERARQIIKRNPINTGILDCDKG